MLGREVGAPRPRARLARARGGRIVVGTRGIVVGVGCCDVVLEVSGANFAASTATCGGTRLTSAASGSVVMPTTGTVEPSC